MICKNCNAEIPDNLTTCPKCGSYTGVTQQQFCTKCGATLTGNEEYCTSCGAYTEKKKIDVEVKKATYAHMVAIGFVFPIVGFIYAAVNSKRNPEAAKATIIASSIGFLIEASVFIPSMSYLFY